ncbi:hypothetical protein HCN_1552 [Helicobacter cinaedi PAGU611]|nr:hypothetical protein C6B36_07425 [Helicobacter cinaedi]BAM12748.1 hypothetical protein HCN_1552 [Helicobacter cinaedi PAGU611]BBB20575.1 hypothetical protein HC081234_17520 [Helicobacter cinaedi]
MCSLNEYLTLSPHNIGSFLLILYVLNLPTYLSKSCVKIPLKSFLRTQSVKLFEKSCNGGYGMGCIYLGDAYENGKV